MKPNSMFVNRVVCSVWIGFACRHHWVF